jgi:hypothetical protein
MVKGTVVNNKGNETGVTVNGGVAMVYGNEFVINHLPLEEGENTIEAIATDAVGTTETASITLYATTPQEYIKLLANSESAIPPVEITLTIESSLDLTNATLIYTSPVEFLSSSMSEYRVGITTEGIYYFTINANAPNGNLFTDTIGIVVLSEADLDALLRGKWETMRSRLASGDVEGALVVFDTSSKEDYRELFNVLSPVLPTVVQDMSDIRFIEYINNGAIYDIRTVRDGVEYSFQLHFIKDLKGVWTIRSF